MEGLNGQLPNLDLVNLVHRLFQQERFTTTLKERVYYYFGIIFHHFENIIFFSGGLPGSS